VATYKVLRATNIAPPGTKLADVKVLGRPLRPDLAGGVAARAPRSAGVWDSTTSGGSGDSASSASSSGPSSSGSDTAGSASEGESAAASSALLAPGGLRAPADDAGDASSSGSGSGSGSEPAATAAAATRAAGAAPAKAAGRLFAVIPLGGTQYKVTPGDLINAERIPTAVVGGSLEVGTVHVVGSAGWTVLGRPAVPGARVTLRVEEQALDRKVIVYKKNRRKRYQRTRGHRRLVTRLRVEAVDYDGGDLVPVAA
jgi:large subunit ribosomal protein L21